MTEPRDGPTDSLAGRVVDLRETFASDAKPLEKTEIAEIQDSLESNRELIDGAGYARRDRLES